MTDRTDVPNADRNRTVAYERRDVNISAILWFAVGLAGLIGISMAVVYGVFWHLMAKEAQATRARFPVAEADRSQWRKTDPARLLPPAPRLESVVPVPEGQEAGRMLPFPTTANSTAPEHLGDAWAWADKDHAAARIPIAEAMRRFVSHAGPMLTARPGIEPPASGGRPSPMNSGRGRPGGSK